MKDALDMLRRDADALVDNAQAGFQFVRFQVNFNGAAHRGIGHSVIEQVIDSLLDAQDVALDKERLLWNALNKCMPGGILAPALDELAQQLYNTHG